MTGSVLFSILVIVVGWALIAWHLAQWTKVDRHETDPKLLAFTRRRFSRRMQTSSLIVLLGLGAAIEPWIKTPIVAIVYWLALLLIVLWIIGLAIGDMILSRQFLQRQRHEEFLEQVKREARPRPERERGEK